MLNGVLHGQDGWDKIKNEGIKVSGLELKALGGVPIGPGRVPGHGPH